jgi:transcriptional regulator with XRE-family HTH domain
MPIDEVTMNDRTNKGMNDKRPDSKGKGVTKPDTHVTPRHVRVPQFDKKIELLYQYHPFIRKQYELAKELNVSPATLSNWINGTPFPDGVRLNPGTIPAKHFSAVLKVFGVPAAVLEMEDLSEFKNTFVTFESGRGAWEKLVRALPDDETIEIIAADQPRRWIEPDEPGDSEGLLRVRNGDALMVRVPNRGLQHGILFAQDRAGWSCLRPSSRSKETEIGEAMVFPRPHDDGSPRFAMIEGSGVHLLLAIFTREPLPTWVMDILLSSDPDRTLDNEKLDGMVSVLHNLLTAGPEKCRMFSRRFLVTNSLRRKSDTRAISKPSG